MALSKVQNLASILGNNALNGGKIDNSFNMFEAPPSNCATDNRCGEYDLWRYDLLGRNSNNQATLEDEEAQDLNNTMVNDLVAKVLEDQSDPIITEEAYVNRYNGNPSRYHNDSQPSRMLKGRNCANPYHDEVLGPQAYYPYNKLPLGATNLDDNQRDFVNMCSGLSTMTLNDCIAQTLDKGTVDYTNGMSLNAHRPGSIDQNQQQQRIRSSNDVASTRNYVPISNGLLTTTNGLNYGVQQSPPNWSEASLTPEYTKDLFGNYQHIQNCSNPDMNFNTIALAELDLHGNMCSNGPPNPYGNQVLNIHDSYNATTNNQQNYRPNSAMTDLSGDSSYLSNSPLQHFSPVDTILQNSLASNYSRINYDDYKDLHDNSGINMPNVGMHGDSMYLQQQQQQQQQQQHQQQQQQKQQQQQSYELDRQMDPNYKALVNRYFSLNDFNLPPANDVCTNDCNTMPVNHNQRIDSSLLDKLCHKSKHRDNQNQSSKLRGYSRALAPQSQIEQQSTTKYNYQVNNGYQRYTASNSESLKAMPPNSSYQSGLKRPNPAVAAAAAAAACSYKIDPYELANEIVFPGGAHVAQQIARASMGNNVFNQIMKQRQQMQRMSGVPAAGVLFNARLMRGASAGSPGVFQSVMPVVQVPVPPLNPMSVLFGGLNLRNGARTVRRAGPASLLHMRLEQTFEQFKQLEKERKKCEAALADHFPGKRVSSANNIPTPRLLGNSSRADRLIVDHFQEHARVITLIAKMEHLRGASMSERVHKAMEYWLEAIKYVQECRKKEIEYANMRRKENPECIPINDEKHVLALAVSIHRLTKASRMARTGMFNALQATLLHDKDLEKKIVETSSDAIILTPAVNPTERQQTTGEIGQFANST